MLMPFWEMRELITTDRKLYWSQQIGCNILMLMPMGFLLPCLHRKFWKIGNYRLCEKISVNSTTVIKNDIVGRLEKQPLNFFYNIQ